MIDSDERSRNYVARGGVLEPKSEEKKAAEQREATTLMVFYSSMADIPPSPREPSSEDFEPAEPEVPFGEPGEITRVSSDTSP